MNLPNKITVLRIFLVPVFMIFIMPIPEWIVNNDLLDFASRNIVSINRFIVDKGNYYGAVIFVIAVSTDRLDGYLARKMNLVTKLGIFLDPLADKLIISAGLIALVQRGSISGWIAMLIIGRELIVTGFRLVAAGEGHVLPADKLGKVKMVSQSIAVALVLLNNYPFSSFTSFQIDKLCMLIAVVLTIYSGLNYIVKNRKVFSE